MKKIVLLLLISFSAYSFQLLDNGEKQIESDDIQKIKNLAAAGDVRAQFNLANRYHIGDGVEKNDELSFYWYKQVAQKDYANAQFNVANGYYSGKGVEKNIEKAIYWYQRASRQNLTLALFNLGFIFEHHKQDLNKAFYWYHRAADLGDGNSQLAIAKFYQYGKGVDKNNKQAEKYFKLAIGQNIQDASDAYAQFLDANQNNQQALNIYKQSANNGSAFANYRLANIYLKDKNKQNDAIKLFIKSANNNYSPAQQKLGEIYSLKKDYKKSAFWYKKAAQNGNAISQYNLGIFYLKGLGGEKDAYRSTQLFIKAAQSGNIDAQYSLAIRYIIGDGVEKNYIEAVRWLKEAAKKGHSNAAYSLSLRYKLGQGVKKDTAQRVFWLNEAVKKDNETAIYELSALTLLGEKTSLENKIAIKNLEKLTKNKVFSARANYHLGRFYLSSNPKLAHTYLVKSSKENYPLAVKLLNKINAQKTNTTNTKTAIKKAPITQQNNTKNTTKPNAIQIYKQAVDILENAKNHNDFAQGFAQMQQSASLGFAPAQNELAMMYLNGIGVKHDLDKAFELAQMAKKNGYLPATQVLIYINNAKNKSF